MSLKILLIFFPKTVHGTIFAKISAECKPRKIKKTLKSDLELTLPGKNNAWALYYWRLSLPPENRVMKPDLELTLKSYLF